MHGENRRVRAGLIEGAALSLFFAPALHPLLRPWVGVASHLLWSIHVLPVAWFAYRWGRSGAVAALPLSGGLIIVGERLWGGGYGLAADWETAVALAVAITATNVLIVGFALYARRAARRLYRSAYRDALTGLPNRRFLAGELRRRLGRLRAGGSQPFAVLFIDLDDFKMVNDSLGHPAGDCVLQQVASRLRGCIKRQDTLARWAGDEFVVLIQDPTPAAAGDVVARRIQETLTAPICAENVDVVLDACVGIVVTSPNDSPERLFRDADTALHSAKSQGKGRRALFDHAMRAAVTARLALQGEMRAGIERGQFVNYYQPIHCTRTGEPQGLEALVRWRHPVRGLLGPGEFIALAERSGQIAALGAMVLEQALVDLAQWQPLGPVVPGFFVAVNASPAQIMADGFFDQVEGACRRHRIDPHCLLLEITESLFMDGSSRMLATLRRLRQLGVRLAIDDFGSGYSSLGYLPRLPVDVLKIDQALVGGLKARQPGAMVGPIIQMAHGLGLRVVAEGVEDPGQLQELHRSACDYVQGFLLSRPMPAGEVPGLLLGRGVTDDENRLREAG